MWPVVGKIGRFEIGGYGLAGLVAYAAIVFWGLRRAKRVGMNRDAVIDTLFWGGLAGLLGSRLLYLVQYPAEFRGLFSLISPRGAGMVFYGSLLTGLPTAWWIARRKGIRFLDLLDTVAPPLALGHGISRIGCFLAGCCYGIPWEGPGSVVFTHPHSAAPLGEPLLAIQLIEAAGLIALALGLSRIRGRTGTSTAAWIGSYAVLRVLTELGRGDAARGYFLPQVFGETLSASTGIALVSLAAITWWWKRPPTDDGDSPGDLPSQPLVVAPADPAAPVDPGPVVEENPGAQDVDRRFSGVE